MTPTQVYDNIRAQCGESGTSFVGETELYTYMTMAERLISNKMLCYLTTDSTVTTTISQREDTLPTGILSILRCEYDSQPLKKIDLRQLDQYEGTAYGGVSPTGQPIYYYTWGTKIGYSPIPSAAKTIKLWVAKTSAELSARSTAFSVPPEYAIYIPDYCLWRIYSKDEMMQQAGFHREQWEGNLALAQNDWEMKKLEGMIPCVKDEDVLAGTDLGPI